MSAQTLRLAVQAEAPLGVKCPVLQNRVVLWFKPGRHARKREGLLLIFFFFLIEQYYHLNVRFYRQKFPLTKNEIKKFQARNGAMKNLADVVAHT